MGTIRLHALYVRLTVRDAFILDSFIRSFFRSFYVIGIDGFALLACFGGLFHGSIAIRLIFFGLSAFTIVFAFKFLSGLLIRLFYLINLSIIFEWLIFSFSFT